MIKDTDFGPAVGTRINRLPIPKFLWQPALFAAVFRELQNGIEYLLIPYGEASPLFRQ